VNPQGGPHTFTILQRGFLLVRVASGATSRVGEFSPSQFEVPEDQEKDLMDRPSKKYALLGVAGVLLSSTALVPVNA
jgi:hypothetical protein